VFYSLDYSFSNYEQARARIHRIGQRNNCNYIHLIAQKTIDEKVFEAIKKKKNIADLVVDNWRSLFNK
jgi:SNF2 family DNA or RNA helicase